MVRAYLRDKCFLFFSVTFSWILPKNLDLSPSLQFFGFNHRYDITTVHSNALPPFVVPSCYGKTGDAYGPGQFFCFGGTAD